MCSCAEIWESFFEGEGISRLHEHVGHARSEKDDGSSGKGDELFAFEVSGLDGQISAGPSTFGWETNSCQKAIAYVHVSLANRE